MKVNPEYEWMREWCPLFGCLPVSPDPPNSVLGHCMSVIIKARDLWEVTFLSGMPGIPLPTPEDISQFTRDVPYVGASKGYPKNRVLTARTIFMAHDSITQHSLVRNPRKDWYEKENGEWEHVNTLASVWERAVDMARYSHAYGYIDPDTPDYAILAILAISEAWDAARDILYYIESEDNRFVIKALQEAQDLLAKAIELNNNETIVPLAEKRMKQIHTNINKAIKTNEIRKQRRKPVLKTLQTEVNDILEKNKNLSLGSIINSVVKRGKVGYSPRHLRRLIKNILPQR